jgi:hypothetical protein
MAHTYQGGEIVVATAERNGVSVPVVVNGIGRPDVGSIAV